MTSETLTIGLVQMCSGCSVERNLKDASRLVREAHAAGARFIATPEMTNILDEREAVLAKVKEEKDDPAPRHFAELAGELGIHLLIGSMALKTAAGKLVNRSLLFTPEGRIAARYDKIHMFDVELDDGLVFRESRSYAAGEAAIVAETPVGMFGLTICYDVRFPQFYRSLARAGAYYLTVPSAFTEPTGEAHWHVLLRARAIENAAFIVAPAQSGRHECGRGTFGHSLIVGPWGEVIVDAGTDEGATVVEVNPALAGEARKRIPALSHNRRPDLVHPAGSRVLESHDPL